jgi:hypothetical protein
LKLMRYTPLICILMAVAATGAQAQGLCEVLDPTGKPLNVRTEPNSRTIVGTLRNGTSVRVEGRELDGRGRQWSYVIPKQGKAGWVFRDFISCWCYPRDVTARVLASPSPNDVHTKWSGKNHIGLSWSLRVKETIKGKMTDYVTGDLYSPRGGSPVEEDVFVLRSEWRCE